VFTNSWNAYVYLLVVKWVGAVGQLEGTFSINAWNGVCVCGGWMRGVSVRVKEMWEGGSVCVYVYKHV
jgi:hypothetical protein